MSSTPRPSVRPARVQRSKDALCAVRVYFVYSCVLRVAARLVADIEHAFAIYVARMRFEHLIVEPVDSRDGSATGQAPHTC